MSGASVRPTPRRLQGPRTSPASTPARSCSFTGRRLGSTITPPVRPQRPPGGRARPLRRSWPRPGPALAPRLPFPSAGGPVADPPLGWPIDLGAVGNGLENDVRNALVDEALA